MLLSCGRIFKRSIFGAEAFLQRFLVTGSLELNHGIIGRTRGTARLERVALISGAIAADLNFDSLLFLLLLDEFRNGSEAILLHVLNLLLH